MLSATKTLLIYPVAKAANRNPPSRICSPLKLGLFFSGSVMRSLINDFRRIRHLDAKIEFCKIPRLFSIGSNSLK